MDSEGRGRAAMRHSRDAAAIAVRLDRLADKVLTVLERLLSRGFDRFAEDPIRWALISVFFGLFVGGGIFSLAEANVGYWDGVWWAFVSMTTVGYGDISPKTDGIRMLATFIIASGILATSLLVGSLTSRTVKRQLRPPNETEVLHDDVEAHIRDFRAVLEQLEATHADLKERETRQRARE
jgi:hypothetical protein